MTIGTVRWFDVPKGYGLIKPDDGGADVMVSICALERAGIARLNQGQRLSFEVVRDEPQRFWIAGPPLNLSLRVPIVAALPQLGERVLHGRFGRSRLSEPGHFNEGCSKRSKAGARED